MRSNPLSITTLALLCLPALACSERNGFALSSTGGTDEVSDSVADFDTVDSFDESASGSADSSTDSGSSDDPFDTGTATTVDTTMDTGVMDTGTADTGVMDTGTADTGTADTGVMDTGTADTGTADTGTADTGVMDTGSTDTGSTTGNGLCNGVCGTPGCGVCPDIGVADVGNYSISATEITIDEYAQFITVDYDVAALPATCSWKDNFTPDSWSGQLNADPNWPVSRVDWCDAWAFCNWSGGHLCGEVGGQPAQLPDYNNGNSNEWYRACANGGTLSYPYGNTYDPMACNSVDLGLGSKTAVGSLPGCEGGVPGLFDMSGNVWEWTNACADSNNTADETEQCRYRGGSYFSNGPVVKCDINATRPRNYRNTNTGIRCCY